ncbi:uncharacterized protein LOC107466191 [Arachis duranensis]|uniref:Uncharacterized protein LOC107466191 n=1 Tax=Arachis duranensis TaxID=130453 RepID=A0A6P4C278_ARADU|nr:uncharacterized protein LOC107466191 [Arachis duranensis]
MRLQSGKIIHMADEMSNVNGGSSTNDSIPVIVQQADVTSRSEGAFGSEIYQQQVEESHHDLLNLLTQQMITILNPMMADHESKFERLARQVERIARIVDYDEGEGHNARGNNEGFGNGFQNENNIFNEENPHVVSRGQNADEVLARLRANHGGECYQVTRIVEEVLNRVGLNVGFMNRPHFVSAFLQVIQMAEVPRGVKNPKIVTKFARKVGESTTEHVANDENLKVKFFSSSLTKNAFTWFSNLKPNLLAT